MASPSAAWRAWPTCSGPVGLADTNSTSIFSPLRGARPKVAPCSATAAMTAWRAAAVMRRLMKPGPAISALSTRPAASGSAIRASTMAWASSRGLRRAGLASCMATLVATSPWAATLGRSSSTLARAVSACASGRLCATAAWIREISCFCCSGSMGVWRGSELVTDAPAWTGPGGRRGQDGALPAVGTARACPIPGRRRSSCHGNPLNHSVIWLPDRGEPGPRRAGPAWRGGG